MDTTPTKSQVQPNQSFRRLSNDDLRTIIMSAAFLIGIFGTAFTFFNKVSSLEEKVSRIEQLAKTNAQENKERYKCLVTLENLKDDVKELKKHSSPCAYKNNSSTSTQQPTLTQTATKEK